MCLCQKCHLTVNSKYTSLVFTVAAVVYSMQLDVSYSSGFTYSSDLQQQNSDLYLQYRESVCSQVHQPVLGFAQVKHSQLLFVSLLVHIYITTSAQTQTRTCFHTV